MSAGPIRGGTSKTGSSASSISVNAVTNQAAGDVLVLFVAYDPAIAGVTITAGGAAWTQGTTAVTNTGGENLTVFYKVANASEPASYTINATSGSGNMAAILTALYASSAVDQVGGGNNGSGTTTTALGVTDTYQSETLVAGFLRNSATGSITPQASMTSVLGSIAVASTIDLNVATELVSASGATGNRTATITSSNWCAFMVSVPGTQNPGTARIKVFAPQPPQSFFD
jgi:hypothetical protein